MKKLPEASAERLANHFVEYLFKKYTGSRHVRRVASWIGLIVLGIERATGQDWEIPRSRQLEFGFADRRFKAKYNHKVGPRGGIEIVEVLPGRGSPEGKTIATISNLEEAEDFYNNAPSIMKRFVKGHQS